jgi:hypothetical protein
MPYCSEAGQSSNDRASTWNAVAGSLKIAFRRRASTSVTPVTPVTVTIDDLVLTSPQGVEVRSRRTIRFTAAIADLMP